MKKILLVVGVLALLLMGGCSALVLGVAIGTAGNEPQQKEKTLTDKQVDKKMDKAVEAEKKAAPPKEEKNVTPKQGQPVQPEVTEQDALNGAQTYYNASSAGDFNYTYNHLTQDARVTYTQEEWNAINQNNGSQGAGYVVNSASQTDTDTYEVQLTVDGTSRTTYFVYDSGGWYHAPTSEEYAIYDGGLSSSASASTSASASASASATSQQPTSGEVAVKVQISANKPVDVSILSAEDMGVPLISEQTQNETYTFSKKADADLSVDASDPNMDITGDADIHIEVYENDELVAEDSDSVMALVQY